MNLRVAPMSQLPWRNWLARSAVNRKVGGSSPPGSATVLLPLFLQSWERLLVSGIYNTK